MTDPITIFYSVDDNYAPYLTVSLASLVAHSDPAKSYRVVILTEGLTNPHTSELKALAAPNVAVDFVSISQQLKAQIDDHGNTLRQDYFTFTIYFRLFIAELFPKLNRAIYIDADTVVLADVADLYDWPLNGAFVAATPDPFIAGNPATKDYAEDAVGVPVTHYCNSGVLVMDLQAMRANRFADHFLKLLDAYHFSCLAPDQDYLNAIAQNKISYLDAAWNTQGTQKGVDSPKLIHYNLFSKPWHYRDAPNADYFWQEAKKLPEYQELQSILADYSEQDVKNDEKHKQKLMDMATAFIEKPATFKKMVDKGVDVAL